MNWFEIENIDEIDSPSIVLYEDRLGYNLHKMLEMVQHNPSQIMPHIKTNKMPNVLAKAVALGIKNFKASTIAEAEIAAMAEADAVLIAHQLVGPKIGRLAALTEKYPETDFSSLADNVQSAKLLNKAALKKGVIIGVYIDINSGMDRSGIKLGNDLMPLILEIADMKGLEFKGLHVYDGHLRDPNFDKRQRQIETQLSATFSFFRDLKSEKPHLNLVCGGTPSFTSHLKNNERISSPGTCFLWDWGYHEKLKEQEFKFAALLISRVISKPTQGIITLDLGHKSVAPENPIESRVRFLNLEGYELLSQSEEHGVLKVSNWDEIQIGDVFYGVPYHICPTINLHHEVSLIKKGKKVDTWKISANKRKITI